MDSLCIVCSDSVRPRQHGIECDGCKRWTHRTCGTGISIHSYRSAIADKRPIPYTCVRCPYQQVDVTTAEDEPPMLEPSAIRYGADSEFDEPPVLEPSLPVGDVYEMDTEYDEPPVLESSVWLDEPSLLEPSVSFDELETIIAQERTGAELMEFEIDDGQPPPMLESTALPAAADEDDGWPAGAVTGSVIEDSVNLGAGDDDDDDGWPAGAVTGSVIEDSVNLGAGDDDDDDGGWPAGAVTGSVIEISVDLAGTFDVGHRDVDDREEPVERSFVDDGAIDDTILPDVAVQYELHETGSKRGGRILVSTDGYSYGVKIVGDPFAQLMSVHAFVQIDGVRKQFTLAFALMSRRQKADHVKVFHSLKDVLADVAVEAFVLDFEKAAWQALADVFPDVTVTKGCTFHWTQAVWRHVQEYGLVPTYRERKTTHQFISQLLALPFLPATHITPTFNALKIRVNTEPLRKLVGYIERQWILSTQFPPSSWSAFQLHVRTNNDVEGWHYRMNHRAGQAGLGFYRLVPLLRREAELVHLHVLAEDLERDTRTGTSRLDARLQEAWTLYTANEISTTYFLRRCAHMYRPPSDHAAPSPQ